MSLSSLIRADMQRLVDEWAAYARDHVKAAATLSTIELEDSTRKLLSAMADDMETDQSAAEQRDKSWGKRPGNSEAIVKYARQHADHRAGQGFTLLDLVSEFRAARASVMRLWAEKGAEHDVRSAELARFNEAVDEAIGMSITGFDAQLERSRDLFLGVLGHDMRSPLGAIMMLANLLLRDETLSPMSAQAATRIYSSGSRLTRMLEDLLDFTRTRLGRSLPVSLREGNMGETVSHVVDELRAYHPATSIRFEATGNLHGRWDFARLAQVVSNLGGNAIQHGDRSHPIDIGLDGLDDVVVLTVHNAGPPIDAQTLARIFDPLTRGGEDKTTARGSIGLGLYICRQIALAHGGTIDVKSEETGTTFQVRIPR